MLNPLPPFPDPYTPALEAYLSQHPLTTERPTLAILTPLLNLFQQSCAHGDLATAVRVLALPLAEDHPLHHWLLEQDSPNWSASARHLQLTGHVVNHPQVAVLTAPERAFLAAAQADRLIYHLSDLPAPGDLLENDPDAASFPPPPPEQILLAAPDVTTAIGFYRLVYRLYADNNYAVHVLTCLSRLIDLSLRERQDARLVEAAQWAKQGITRAQQLHLPAETAGFLYQLAVIQNALDEDLAAYTSLAHLLRLPAPGAPTAILQRAWRLLGYLYEFRGDPIDALVCYLKTLPPTDQPPQTVPEFASGVLGAFELGEGQDVLNRAHARLRDHTWFPPPFPVTALPPYPDPPGDLLDELEL